MGSYTYFTKIVICFIIQIATMCLCSKVGILDSILSWLGLWLFFGLMTKSYFIKKYLEKHIVLEVDLDELMMPIMMICISTLTNMFNSFVNNANVTFFLNISFSMFFLRGCLKIFLF